MPIFNGFAYHFFRLIWHVRAVILSLIALVVAGGAAVALFEKMPFGDALYFAFITGLTIGYGDIFATSPVGRLLAILIGFIGVIFTGLIIAVAVRALRESFQESEKRG